MCCIQIGKYISYYFYPVLLNVSQQKNMTLAADGVFTMNTGVDEINKVGLQTAWDYSSQTVFPGECGEVRGSFGDEFPPNSTTGDQIFIFANDLCRYCAISYKPYIIMLLTNLLFSCTHLYQLVHILYDYTRGG